MAPSLPSGRVSIETALANAVSGAHVIGLAVHDEERDEQDREDEHDGLKVFEEELCGEHRLSCEHSSMGITTHGQILADDPADDDEQRDDPDGDLLPLVRQHTSPHAREGGA